MKLSSRDKGLQLLGLFLLRVFFQSDPGYYLQPIIVLKPPRDQAAGLYIQQFLVLLLVAADQIQALVFYPPPQVGLLQFQQRQSEGQLSLTRVEGIVELGYELNPDIFIHIALQALSGLFQNVGRQRLLYFHQEPPQL